MNGKSYKAIMKDFHKRGCIMNLIENTICYTGGDHVINKLALDNLSTKLINLNKYDYKKTELQIKNDKDGIKKLYCEEYDREDKIRNFNSDKQRVYSLILNVLCIQKDIKIPQCVEERIWCVVYILAEELLKLNKCNYENTELQIKNNQDDVKKLYYEEYEKQTKKDIESTIYNIKCCMPDSSNEKVLMCVLNDIPDLDTVNTNGVEFLHKIMDIQKSYDDMMKEIKDMDDNKIINHIDEIKL